MIFSLKYKQIDFEAYFFPRNFYVLIRLINWAFIFFWFVAYFFWSFCRKKKTQQLEKKGNKSAGRWISSIIETIEMMRRVIKIALPNINI